MAGVVPIDVWVFAAIAAQAVEYAAMLVAMGGPVFVAVFRSAPTEVLLVARRFAVVAALLCVCMLALRFGISAARLSGLGLAGATDPVMLGIIWDSPFGTAAMWRGIGAVLILFVLSRRRIGAIIRGIGVLLIAISYTFFGHTAGAEPRWALTALLSLHLIAAAFWVGGLAPLHRAATTTLAAALLHYFGVIAVGVVAALAAAGATLAWILVGSASALITTAYGWTLMAKLLVVVVLLGLAAQNKFKRVPALIAGDPKAVGQLQRAIRFEMSAVAVILLLTAALTTLTTPPMTP